MTVRYQSSSMSSWLSVLSPVAITMPNGSPVYGPWRTALTRSTSDDAPRTVRASCGRYALSLYRARYSNRTGDSVSARCRSVNCTKEASPVRRSSRPAPAAASSPRTTSGHPGPATRRLYAPEPTGSAACSRVVPPIRTAREAVSASARSGAGADHRAAPAAAADILETNWRRLIPRMCIPLVTLTVEGAAGLGA